MLLDRIETREVAAAKYYLRSLHSDHEQMRLQAAGELVELGEPAVEPLVNALRERREPVWMLAASALVKIGEPAVGALVEALFDEDEQVRILAVGALGRIRHARAVQPLIYAIRQEKDEVQGLMVWALVKIGQPAVGPLLAALRDNLPQVQMAAAQALGEIGDPQAVIPLKGLQKSDHKGVQQAVNEALAKLRQTAAQAG
jgi:HEAT repeat protein